jgi:predicted methyltransferase
MTKRLTELAHEAVRASVRPGDIAVDATAGNGHDTRFLAEIVGASGHVFALDIQPEALTRTAAAVRRSDTVTLIRRDHAELRAALPAWALGRVAAVMFNLGYLPGSDRHIVTRAESTLPAVRDALEVIRPGGVVTILAYAGHPGGAEESESVASFLKSLPDGPFRVTELTEPKRRNPPRLFVVHKAAVPG